MASVAQVNDDKDAKRREIDRRRIDLGMKRTTLAAEAGVNRGHLSEYLLGKADPSPEWIADVERALSRRERQFEPDEPPALELHQPRPLRFIVEGVYGAKALIVEADPGDREALEAAVDRIMRNLQQGPDSTRTDG